MLPLLYYNIIIIYSFIYLTQHHIENEVLSRHSQSIVYLVELTKRFPPIFYVWMTESHVYDIYT